MRNRFVLQFLILILHCLVLSINPYACSAQTSGRPISPIKPGGNMQTPVESEKAECEGVLPTILFPAYRPISPIKPKSNAATLQPNAITTLQSVAAQLKERPDCKLKVEGHASGDKMSQQLSWDRVNAIIRYLVEKTGISEKRFIFEYGSEGDPNVVDLMYTSEDGPTSVPQPHPQFRTTGQ